jgi:ATPase subunit of ABC transporter with duplicated ATPase domains
MLDRLLPLLLAAAIGASAGWWIEHQRAQARIATLQSQWDKERAQQAEQLARAAQAAHQRTIALQREVEHAQSEAHAQHQAAARSAAAARTELERLRATLGEARAALRVSAPASAPCDAGAVCTELLGACASRYQELAAETDQLAIDLRTVISAWPKESEHGR